MRGNRMKKTGTAALVMAMMLWAGAAFADVPQLLTQQARLLDSSGVPAQGNQTIVFTFYGSPTGSTALWTETHTVTLDDGYFVAALGELTPFPSTLFDGSPLYLGIKVG